MAAQIGYGARTKGEEDGHENETSDDSIRKNDAALVAAFVMKFQQEVTR